MNRAFTLAEILITIGIIGIVAVLTLPVCIQKYQEKVTMEKLKVTSSIMSQALKKLQLEEGTPGEWGLAKKSWENEADTLILANNIKKAVKVLYDCGFNDSKGQCTPLSGYKFLNGGNGDNFATRKGYYKLVLANGTSIVIRNDMNANIAGMVYVDTNGKKSPNMWGRDLFLFSIGEKGEFYPAWGAKSGELTETSKPEYCNTTGSQGITCSAWIMKYGNMNYLHK